MVIFIQTVALVPPLGQMTQVLNTSALLHLSFEGKKPSWGNCGEQLWSPLEQHASWTRYPE